MQYPDIAISSYTLNNGHETLPCEVVNYISTEAKIWYLIAAQSSDNFVPHQGSNPIHVLIWSHFDSDDIRRLRRCLYFVSGPQCTLI